MEAFFLILFFAILIITFYMTDGWFSVARIYVTVWTFLFSGYALFMPFGKSYSGVLWILFSCIIITLGEFAAQKFFYRRQAYINPYRNLINYGGITEPQTRYSHGSVYLVLCVMTLSGLSGVYLNVRLHGFGLGSFFSISEIKNMINATYASEKNSLAVSVLLAVSYAGAISGGFTLIKSKKVWQRLLCFATVIPSVIYMVTTSRKQSFLCSFFLFVIGVIVSYLFTFRKNKSFKPKEIIIALLTVIGMIAALFFSLAFRYNLRFSYTGSRFSTYAFGSVEAFNVWFSSYVNVGKYGFGINTFLAPFYALGLAQRQTGFYNYVPGAVSNVFTAFRGLIVDFGSVGALVFIFFLGFLGHLSKERIKLGKFKIINVFLYSVILFYVFNSFLNSPFVYVTFVTGLIIFLVFMLYDKYAYKLFAFLKEDESKSDSAITGKKIASNVAVSIAVQVVSLLANIVINLIVPKFIDKAQYGNWQTFVLYLGYVGLLHFGVLDGIVLRYSQYGYDKLDKKKIRSQFFLLLSVLTVIFIIMTGVSVAFTTGVARNVIILVGLGVITRNAFTYSSYLCQITNRIKKYAILVITQRVAHALIVVVLLILKVNDYRWYCLSDLLGDVVAVAVSFVFNKELFFGKAEELKGVFKEFIKNVSAGILLLIANWSATFLVSGAQMVVSWRWLEEIFADVALAFKVTSLVLMFVTAVSVVLFPSLKRMDENKLPSVYKNVRQALSFVMFLALLFYFPGRYILLIWLPNYSTSLVYLAILMPIVVYSSKVTLLTNNYMKVYRKERTMFIINLLTVAIGFGSFVLSAFVFNDLTLLLVMIVAAVTINSIVSEMFVLKIIKVKVLYEFITETVMTVGFILSAYLLPLWIGFGVYAVLFAAYFAINLKSVKETFGSLKKRPKV